MDTRLWLRARVECRVEPQVWQEEGIFGIIHTLAATGHSFTVRIYDVTGRIVFIQQTTDPALKVNTQSFPQGVYYYTIEGNEVILGSGKVLVMH